MQKKKLKNVGNLWREAIGGGGIALGGKRGPALKSRTLGAMTKLTRGGLRKSRYRGEKVVKKAATFNPDLSRGLG